MSTPAVEAAIVEVSHDGGRNWRRHEFPLPQKVDWTATPIAAIATRDGHTAYAIVRDASGGTAAVYRTSDGGATWHRTRAELPVPRAEVVEFLAIVHPDGALTVQIGGFLAGTSTFQSKDGGDSFQRALPIPTDGFAPMAVSGGYAQPTLSDGIWLSTDGREWTHVEPPPIP